MQNHQDNPWNAIVRAAQPPGDPRPCPPATPPSADFIHQVRLMRANLWQFAKLLLWRRCALVCAILAIALYAICHWLLQPAPARLISTPAHSSLPLTR
jgi:hypothetical protein